MHFKWKNFVLVIHILKPISFKNDSVQVGSTAVDHVGQHINTEVARSSQSDLDAVICKWQGLWIFKSEAPKNHKSLF